MAHGWKARQSAATGGVLADFGEDPWILLECVPNYVNVVASFNAAYAGMTRSFAGLLRTLGRTEAAAIADAEADTLAQAVTGMSLPHGALADQASCHHRVHRPLSGLRAGGRDLGGTGIR